MDGRSTSATRLVREPPELLAEAVVEGGAVQLREAYLVVPEAQLDALPGDQLAHRAPVSGDVDRVALRCVRHSEGVARRDHERAGGEGVRRDEGDDVALHSPRQD